jgi:hypothetical protein
MEDYNQIFEAYKTIKEAGFSYAGNYSDSTLQPKRQLAKFKRPKGDYKNSTAMTTASLPTGGQKVNMAAMGTGGGIENNEEQVNIKGIGKLPSNEVHKMYNKLMKEVHTLYTNKKYSQLQGKLELMSSLAKNL